MCARLVPSIHTTCAHDVFRFASRRPSGIGPSQPVPFELFKLCAGPWHLRCRVPGYVGSSECCSRTSQRKTVDWSRRCVAVVIGSATPPHFRRLSHAASTQTRRAFAFSAGGILRLGAGGLGPGDCMGNSHAIDRRSYPSRVPWLPAGVNDHGLWLICHPDPASAMGKARQTAWLSDRLGSTSISSEGVQRTIER